MTDQRKGLLDRIRALLSKTVDNGCTEEEALAALAKARSMIDVYEVSDEELELTKKEKASFYEDPTRDRHSIRFNLIGSIGKFTECKAYRDKDGYMVFVGLPSDGEFALWLLDTLTNFVECELVEFMATCPGTKSQRRMAITDFVNGCTSRISERLRQIVEESQKQQSDNSRALVVTKKHLIAEALDGMRFTKSSAKNVRGSEHYFAGRSAGERASFGRPVEGTNKVLRLK